ncbi:MAG TPA: CheR family methyltransferase [Plasticicumulans sp.]|uniref:CheR family methyltransferase n=1 Tax=Plasticicumulans sp. TaxID=2307179 RepID=UPI002B62268A|nr:CheR family methyltransferase [Plasticicumulans sp.]HMW30642.1 CheR family methyltransferase [Plasticicumulans sp.]
MTRRNRPRAGVPEPGSGVASRASPEADIPAPAEAPADGPPLPGAAAPFLQEILPCSPAEAATETATEAATPAAGREPPGDLYVVGIGASAGGLEALRPLIANLVPNGRLSYLIAQHMSTQHRSLLVDLLARDAQVLVVEATGGAWLRPDTVYVTPPDRDILVSSGRIVLRRPGADIGPRPSVDALLNSLATEYAERAIGVILSGTGSDGAHGCRAIKARGGFTIVQEPGSAKYDAMPRAAQRADAVDLALPPELIARRLPELVDAPAGAVALQSAEEGSGAEGEENGALRGLLERVLRATQTDFTDYKEATLGRQIGRRLAALRLESLSAYLDYVDQRPEELGVLQRSFLISVTEFFRDPDAFRALERALEPLIAGHGGQGPIRVWVPGCATGEEAYSLAMLFAQRLGSRAVGSVKIFATDIDPSATEFARRGIYPEPAVQGLEPELRERWFRQEGRHYLISKTIRDLCVFARQDLVRDPPFLRMDLISCRNLLIYLKPNLQERLLNQFHYSLTPGGYLFLGKSENITQSGRLFSTVDGRYKLFRRKSVLTPRPLMIGSGNLGIGQPASTGNRSVPSRQARLEAMRDELLDRYAPPSILLGPGLEPMHFCGDARRFLRLPDGPADFGLLSLLLPEMRGEFRTLQHRLQSADGSDHVSGHMVPVHTTLGSEYVRMRLSRLTVPEASEDMMLLSIEPMRATEPPPAAVSTGAAPAGSDHDHAVLTERLRDAENELGATREHLQAVIEELETSNEELQSLNEELQASTEELQSSNEELETTNEELQATNEELTTVNDELEAKSEELTQVNTQLVNIQQSVALGLIVVDADLRVMRYNPPAVRVFGLMNDDLGQSLLAVPSFVEIGDLRRKLLDVVGSGRTLSEELRREEATFLMQIAPYREDSGVISGAVITLSDITRFRELERAHAEGDQRLRLIADALQDAIWLATPGFTRMLYVSRGYFSLWERTPESLYADPHSFLDAVHFEDRARVRRQLLETDPPATDLTYRLLVPGAGQRWVRQCTSLVRCEESGPALYLATSVRDVTAAAAERERLQHSEMNLRTAIDLLPIAALLRDAEGRVVVASGALSALLGYRPEALVGHPLGDVLCAEDAEGERARYLAARAAGERSYTQAVDWRRADGTTVPGRLSVRFAASSDEVGDLSLALALLDELPFG